MLWSHFLESRRVVIVQEGNVEVERASSARGCCSSGQGHDAARSELVLQRGVNR